MEANAAEPPKELPVRRVSSAELIRLLIKQMRPKQWTKNLICYLPLLFSGQLTNLDNLLAATGCFIVFCMISSGIYILNDIVDAPADRAHPVKKNRPIASGRLNIGVASILAAFLLIGGLAFGYYVRPSVAIVCLGYALLNLCYSGGLKHIAIIDILCIAASFVFRALAGVVAVHVHPSSWFLLCTTLGALWLALEKRRQEIVLLTDNSAVHRKSLEGYTLPLIDRLESVIVPSLLTAYAFYTFGSEHSQSMMITIPAVIYGIMRYQMLSERGSVTGTPEEVLLKDKPIQLTVVVWVLLCVFVVYCNPHDLVVNMMKNVDRYSVRPTPPDAKKAPTFPVQNEQKAPV